MRKHVPIVAAVMAMLLAASVSVTLACSCSLDPAKASQRSLVSQARRDATFVLSGTVLAIEQGMIGVVPARYSLVRMKVDRVWKGRIGGEVVIQTGLGSGDCGYRFEVGQGYLVYGWGELDTIHTDICTRTRGLDEAIGDIKILGRARRPALPRTTPN